MSMCQKPLGNMLSEDHARDQISADDIINHIKKYHYSMKYPCFMKSKHPKEQ